MNRFSESKGVTFGDILIHARKKIANISLKGLYLGCKVLKNLESLFNTHL